ncbi:glycosyltransferase [Mycobacterium sp. HNNTM2301]|uniref:glycosyltransferase family protein n=1 Tax=Mycobacterium hainanense TaxID=3289775 RepID=UPI0035A63729
MATLSDRGDVIADTWYAEALGLPSLDTVAVGWVGWLAHRGPLGRGLALWWLGRRKRVIVTTPAGASNRVLLLMARLSRRPTPQLVLLEFIPVIGAQARAAWRGGPDSRTRALASAAFWRLVARPVLQRRLLAAHTPTEWEAERFAQLFGLPAQRFRHVPWLSTAVQGPMPSQDGRHGVLASGRAACDWEAVFAAADGQPWPLTVVCSRSDEPTVRRLNRDHRATVLCEIPREEHDRLMRSAAVYLLALRDAAVSTGQVRLAEAAAAGTPVVASDVPGLAGYLEDGRTALVYRPGDGSGAREAIARLYADPELRASIALAAWERSQTWTRDRYLEAIGEFVDSAIGALSD